MLCPYCQTENREDRETCYVCGKDISTVRLIVNKARQHYNDALEHAERDRVTEAIDELKNAIDLDSTQVNAHVVLGTLYARQGKFAEARECWKQALALQPEMERAHDYLERVESVQAALPTIKTYRRIALLLLVVAVALAAFSIYKLRPEPGTASLRSANAMISGGQYGQARAELEQAEVLADPKGIVKLAASSLKHSLSLDLQQRLRLIQDLKYRQMYPEALAAMAELEATGPDKQTSAALATIREDIGYYYRNMLSQLYAAYEKGDLDFDTLQTEVSRFVSLYPPSPERDEVQAFIDRAEGMEVQAAMDELRRRFSLDNNVQTAVEGLRDLAPRFENLPAFQSARSAFVEEILSYLFNLFTGYLDQDDFERASSLLMDIENVSTEFRDMVEIDISGAVELAWSVLKDARRQYQFRQIEKYISNEEMDTAEDALWEVLQEPDLSGAEMGVIRSYWRRINQRDRLKKLLASRQNDSRFYSLKMNEQEASETLELYEDLKNRSIPHRQELQLTGLAAASAIRLGDNDQATSLVATLRSLDENSSITRTIRNLLRERLGEEIKRRSTSTESKIRVEPSRPSKQQKESLNEP